MKSQLQNRFQGIVCVILAVGLQVPTAWGQRNAQIGTVSRTRTRTTVAVPVKESVPAIVEHASSVVVGQIPTVPVDITPAVTPPVTVDFPAPERLDEVHVDKAELRETGLLEIKFRDGLQIRLVKGRPVDLNGRALRSEQAEMILDLVAGGEWWPSHIVDELWLTEAREMAAKYWGEHMPDLNLYFRLHLPAMLAVEAEKMRRLFEILPEVEAAYHVPAPVDLPAPATDYSAGVPNDILSTPLQYQGYLDSAANGGVDARFAWNQPGGLGENVNVVDIERGWSLNHEDLPQMTQIGNEIISIDPTDFDHGNAVMGVIVGLDNGFGAQGIAPLAKPFVKSPGLTDVDENLGAAIIHAASALNEGDVILIEQQTSRWIMEDGGICQTSADVEYLVDCPRQLLPVEWYRPTFDAIRLAVGLGIVVVEAAGNGGQNLTVMSELNAVAENDGHDPFAVDGKGTRLNDSGAILVGAGYSPRANAASANFPTRGRHFFSNYGPRVDVQAWGDSIVTLGYGDLFFDTMNSSYTNTFGGTSGASAIIAGVVASLQSVHEELRGRPATPHELRALLIETGTWGPQTLGQLGPQPDLKRGIEYLMGIIAPPALANPIDENGPPLAAPYDFVLEAPAGFDPDNTAILLTLDGTDPDEEGLGYDEGGIGFDYFPGEVLTLSYSIRIKYRAYLRRAADGSLFEPGERPFSDVVETRISLIDGTVPDPEFSLAQGTYVGSQALWFTMPAEFSTWQVWYTVAPDALADEPYPGGPNSMLYEGAIWLEPSTSFQPVKARAYAPTQTSGVLSISESVMNLYMIQNP